MATSGTLFLVPSNIGQSDGRNILPEAHLEIVRSLDLFFVENEKAARKFLKLIAIRAAQRDIVIYSYDKHAEMQQFDSLINDILAGKDAGLISDAGVPCVADPGASLVAFAHRKNIKVIPLVGPSSILLALMASGLNGQQFTFHGYLPIIASDRVKKIRDIERNAGSQIFIETPYRSDAMLGDILKTCNKNTMLCIAAAIGDSNESVQTKSIEAWKGNLPKLGKTPCVFILAN